MAEALPTWSIVDKEEASHTITVTKKIASGLQGLVFEATMDDKHILVKQMIIIDNLYKKTQLLYLRQQISVEIDLVTKLSACSALSSGFTCFRGIAAPNDFIETLPAESSTYYYTSHETLLIYDFLPGKELFKYLAEDQDSATPILTDVRKISIIRQLLQILVKQADNDIISRDIKLENLMYNHETDVLKIIDYGFGCKRATCNLKTFQGSTGYIAPEIYSVKVKSEHALAVDMFAAGMAIFTLLHNWSIFGVHAHVVTKPHPTDADVKTYTTTGAYYGETTKDYLNRWFTKTDITENTLPLILHMIHPDPAKRPTASAALATFNEICPVPAVAVGGRRTRSRRRSQSKSKSKSTSIQRRHWRTVSKRVLR